jgi:hypothetical protein
MKRATVHAARLSSRRWGLRARLRPAAVSLWVVMACGGLLLGAACRRAPPATPVAPAETEKAASAARGVTLKPEEIDNAGIKTTALAPASHAPENTGYAVVVARETLAQAVADLTSAAAVERQSRSALARGRSLAGTPGAMPIESQEAAERQATVDHAARLLVERRLSATYGQNAPWNANYDSPVLSSLARGDTKLVRVTFPLGALGSTAPTRLRLTHIGEVQGSRTIESLAVWGAPADASIPGRSFFATVNGSDVSEGEHLVAHAAVGPAEPGVVVPFSAVLINAGKYWCYIEQKPGVFVRTEVDPSMPLDEGYFIKRGLAPGAKVVTSSAGLLLAHEINPGSGAGAD